MNEIKICKSCHEQVELETDWIEKEKLCIFCYNEGKTTVCLTCGKEKPKREYWGECESCWNKSVSKMEKYNRQIYKEV